jgi:hypothetical protein
VQGFIGQVNSDGVIAVTMGKRNHCGIRLFLIVERSGEKTCHNKSFMISEGLIELDVMELIDVLKEPIK